MNAYDFQAVTTLPTTYSPQVDALGVGAPASATAGTVVTAPPTSATATAAFGQTVVGTALQNTLGYDLLVVVTIVVTAATTASISAGVGPTSTPTTSPVVSSFSIATAIAVPMIVPAGHWCLVQDGGTITLGAVTTWATPI